NIEFLGRIDEQVKIRGFRIELGEIESVLRKQQGITDVAVIAREYNGENYLCGYYISPDIINVYDLKEGMKKELPDYMIPAYMMQVDEIPMTKNGKLDRNALPAVILDSKQEYIAPKNELQKRLCEFFQEVLEVKQVGIQDDFFSLGGHSLKIARLANKINTVLGIKISLKSIFSHTTVADLAAFIQTGAENEKKTGITKAEKKQYYPMSSTQKRMYLIQQMEEGSTAYNISESIKLPGTVDPDHIRMVLQQMVDRHEILRTSFLIVNGMPVQEIHPHVEVNFTYREDFTQNKEILFENFVRPFNLSDPSLLRAELVKQQDGYFLMLDMHHIVSDGASDAVFIREFNELYAGKQLPMLEYQYKDYSEWMSRRDLTAQRDYWTQIFQGEIPVLDLPLDYKRPQKQSYRGHSLVRPIGKELTQKLTNLLRCYDATDYMIFMAAAMILLQKYSRQEDIVIGSPVNGRVIPEVENMLGMFANTLAIRAFPEDEKTVGTFLTEMRDICLHAYENQEYPFEELVEQVNVNRDFSRNPLFDVMLVMQNNIIERYEMEDEKSGVNAEDTDVTSKFDLTFSIVKDNNEYYIGLQYCIDLFKRETAEYLLSHFIRILEQMSDNTNMKIKEIDTVTRQEKQIILERQSSICVSYPREKTIVNLFEEQVERTPDHIAVTYEGKTLTYRELNHAANALAEKLRECGVKPNDFVVMLTQRSLEMIIGIYGILKAGGAYVPIDPTYPEDRIAYTIQDCQPKVVLIYDANDIDMPDNIKVIDLSECKYENQAFENPEHVNQPEDVAYVIYTSGTTGKPKGVMVQHKNVVRLMVNDQFQYDFNDQDVWMMFHSYCFDFSVWEMYGATLYGGMLVVLPKEAAQDSSLTLNYIEKNHVTVLNQVPSAFYNLMRIDENSMSSVRYLIFGGEALQPDKLESWHSKYPSAKIVNMYGITETTVHVTYREIGDAEIERGISDVGTAIPTLSVYIMNGDVLCGVGIPGELCVTGDGVAGGYLNRPELTAE
ncbi:MAG: amino acid adenylation domain-containing protein, partial [Ruminococcus sp.]